MAYDVFISYSSKDQLVANAICAKLEEPDYRIRCWIAYRDIRPGDAWDEGIMDALSECKIMVLVFSSNANQSEFVKMEVPIAARNGLIIIPFRIEATEPAKALQLYLYRKHWLDAVTAPMERHLETLALRVKANLAIVDPLVVPPPAPPVVPPPVPPVVPSPDPKRLDPSQDHTITDSDLLELTELLRLNSEVGNSVEHQWTLQSKLRSAAEKGRADIVRLLLDHGVAVDARGAMKRTALMEAASRGKTEVMTLLLDRGADINALEHYRQTALHLAAYRYQPEAVNLLIQRGADTTILDERSKTAAQYISDDTLAALLTPENIRHPVWPRPIRGMTEYEELNITPREARQGTAKTILHKDAAIDVTVLLGSDEKTVITIEGKGGPGWHGGPNGPLLVRISLLPGVKDFARETGLAIFSVVFSTGYAIVLAYVGGWLIDQAWNLYDVTAGSQHRDDSAPAPGETALSHAARMLTATPEQPHHDVVGVLLPYLLIAGTLFSFMSINSEDSQARCGVLPKLIGGTLAGLIAGCALNAAIHSEHLYIPILGAIFFGIITAAMYYGQNS